MNTYRLQATCLCPFNDGRDFYNVEVHSDEMIRIEQLKKFFDGYANDALTQEELTQKFKDAFAGVRVRIVGSHPVGVQVESS